MKFRTRKTFEGTRALRNRINPTRISIQNKESVRGAENVVPSTRQRGGPSRCVHVCDREADIFELFCAAGAVGAHVLIRTCADRAAGWGTTSSRRWPVSRSEANTRSRCGATAGAPRKPGGTGGPAE